MGHAEDRITFAIGALTQFISSAAESRQIPQKRKENLLKKVALLLIECEKGQLKEQAAQKEFNALVLQLNRALPLDAAPFPGLVEDPKAQAAYQVLAFEGFLVNEQLAGALPIEYQHHFFIEALDLWESINTRKRSPREGMKELKTLIEKTNRHLPEEAAYPIPKPASF